MYCIKENKSKKENCICVHAEQNAIAQAAQFGISVRNCRIYTTVQPCFSCLKEIIQAGIKSVRYLKDYDQYSKPILYQYQLLKGKLTKGGMEQVYLPKRGLWIDYDGKERSAKAA